MVKHGLGKNEVGTRAHWATLALNPPITVMSVATTVMTLMIVGSELVLPAPPRYGRLVLLLISLAVMTKHLTSVIDFQTLSTSVRRSVGNPHFSFGAIAVADLLTLIVAFSFYTAWGTGEHVSFNYLRKMTISILTVEKLRDAVVSGQAFTWVECLISIAGGLYLINGFKAILKYRDFERTTEDLHAIASNQITVGNAHEARRWLDKVQKPEAATYELYVCAYLLGGNLKNAENAAESYVEEKRVADALRPNEMARVILSNAGFTPIPKEDLLRYLAAWLANPQDLYLQNVIEALIRQGRIQANEVLPLFTSHEIRKQHALTLSSLLFSNDEFKAALEVLQEYTATNTTEDLVRICLTYRCFWIEVLENMSEEALGAIRLFEKDQVPKLAPLAENAATDHERLIILEYLYLFRDVSALLSSSFTKQIDRIALDVRDEIGGDERILVTLRALDSIGKARQRELSKPEFNALRSLASAASL